MVHREGQEVTCIYICSTSILCCTEHYYYAHAVSIQLVFMLLLFVQVRWSSLRPTQMPLMCVELVASPSGVNMRVCRMCFQCSGSVTAESILVYGTHCNLF